ncbi:MAG: type II toxin-antitoxin system Phd/YefM family antitoxin [Desulfobacterales bacterium]
MMTVSATELRKNIFAYLDRIAQGERIAILRNKRK